MLERTAVLSDIHGNSPALATVLGDIQRVGCDHLYILGDLVNGIDPAGTLAMIDQLGERAKCIRGNAEAYILTPDLDHLPDRDQAHNRSLIHLIGWFRDQLSAANLAWLAQLPESIMWQSTCMVHDSPLDRFFPEAWRLPHLEEKYQEWFFHSSGYGSSTPEHNWQLLWDWMEQQDLWAVFCGHTHVPLVRRLHNRWVGNAGAAGFPLDNDPRPSWLLVERRYSTGLDNGITITIRRVEYDIDRVIRMIDDRPDYLAWDGENHRQAYRMMLKTGTH